MQHINGKEALAICRLRKNSDAVQHGQTARIFQNFRDEKGCVLAKDSGSPHGKPFRVHARGAALSQRGQRAVGLGQLQERYLAAAENLYFLILL